MIKSSSKDGNILLSLTCLTMICQSISWPQVVFFLLLFLIFFLVVFLLLSFVGKIRRLVLKPNWSVMTSVVLAKAFSGTDLWKWLWCILGRNKLASWFKFKRLKLVEGPNLKHWPLSTKAVTVFNTGSSLWFKPFNGFFHLNAIVLSFLSWWSAALWWPERVTACCTSCHRFVTALLFLCCDWMTMRHFVLPHRVFTCPSDTRLPIRTLLGFLFFCFFNRHSNVLFF